MRGQRDVLAQLPQELAFAAAEAARLPARRDQHAEHLAFHQQRRRHQRAQPAARQPLRKRKPDLADVRLVHQLAAHAARQAVLVDRDASLLGHRQLQRQRLAVARPTLVHGQRLSAGS